MTTPSGAPGACVDCGNDAYIRLANGDGEERMVCAHCFGSHREARRANDGVAATTKPQGAATSREPAPVARPPR